MPTSPEGFRERSAGLAKLLAAQGQRVQRLVEVAFDSIFGRSEERAREAIALDDEVDRIDVQIERAAVKLLAESATIGSSLSEPEVRRLLTIVKVNNELERIADVGVFVAEHASAVVASGSEVPATFRVMANSVVGILRDVTRAIAGDDAVLARVVLNSEHTVEAFKETILRDAEKRIAEGRIAVDFAFLLHELANLCERMADHASNVAEQVIYNVTGAIVRHTEEAWRDVPIDSGQHDG